MNSSLRIEAGSGIWPFSRAAIASLNDTSLTLSENVENALSRVWISGCGIGALAGGLGNAVLFSIGQQLRASHSRVVYFAGYKKIIDRYKVEEIEKAADVVVWVCDEAPGFTPTRVQDSVVLAHTLAINRADPDFYALQLGNSVLGGGFYSTRLSVDLRKNAGLVYSVGSSFAIGRTRGSYAVQYASDPQNVSKAAALAVNDIRAMQTAPVSDEELSRSKMLLLRQIPLGEDSINDIAAGLLGRIDLDLPLDEPQRAARRFIDLTPAEVQAAFKKWLRPDDLVRVTQGPAPQ